MAPEDNLASQAVAASEPAAQNFFSRLVNVWFSPGEAFRNIGLSPDFVLPIIALILIGALGSYLVIDRFGRAGIEDMARKQIQSMVDRGFIPQDKAEEVIQQNTPTEANFTTYKIKTALQGSLTWVVMALVVAGILKLITMMMGADTTFKKVFSVALYSYLAVAIVYSVIVVAVLYLKSPEEIDIYNPVESNLGSLLKMTMGKDALPGFVTAFASFIDLFYIWRIALLSIGLAAVSKLKTGTAAMFVGGLFLLFALIAAPLMSFFM